MSSGLSSPVPTSQDSPAFTIPRKPLIPVWMLFSTLTSALWNFKFFLEVRKQFAQKAQNILLVFFGVHFVHTTVVNCLIKFASLRIVNSNSLFCCNNWRGHIPTMQYCFQLCTQIITDYLPMCSSYKTYRCPPPVRVSDTWS